MVKGIGVDLVEMIRVRRLVSGKRGNSFIKKTFTDDELDYINGKVEHFATTFAAKEAVFKAFGTGILNLNEVEVIRNNDGAPTIKFHGELKELIKKRKIRKAQVSLSFTGCHAAAVVVLL
jgi:holo-[acyl-carrier protein] synthase